MLDSSRNIKIATRMGLLAIAGFSFFVLAIIVLHFLRPEISPIERTMSEYAVGPYGGLMVAGFFAFSGGAFALAIGLYHVIPRSARFWAVILLLAVSGVGILLVGIFPTDLAGAPATTTGAIHTLSASVATFSLMIGLLVLVFHTRKIPAWEAFYRPALIFGLVTILAYVLWATILTAAGGIGLGQRVFIALLGSWLIYTAAYLRQNSG